jgi:putative phage-type endonuclease
MLLFPKTREEWLSMRHQYICSTDQAALHGLSPYMTAFELFHEKQQKSYTEWEAGERAEWGLALEEAVARKIAADYGVKVRKLSAFAVNDEYGMGASFDYEIVGLKEEWPADAKSALRAMYQAHGAGILEIKCVDWMVFKRQWEEVEGELEAPAHIEIQVQHQLCLIERAWAAIGILVGGNQLKLIVRERDTEVGEAIIRKSVQFWRDIKANKAPDPCFPADAAMVARLYIHSVPDKVLDAQGNVEVAQVCHDYLKASADKKMAEGAQETAKAKLLMLIGDNAKVLVDGGISVSAGTVKETLVEAFTRKAYRNVRVTQKGTK